MGYKAVSNKRATSIRDAEAAEAALGQRRERGRRWWKVEGRRDGRGQKRTGGEQEDGRRERWDMKRGRLARLAGLQAM